MNQIPPDRSTPPELHTFDPLSLKKARIDILPNGITIHTCADPNVEVCRIAVAIPGGDAETGRDAAMRVIAPALSEGTISHSGSRIAELLEDYGAWSGASLSTHHTVYSLSCLSRYFPELLPLTREIVLEPAFEEEAMKRLTERLATRNEIDRCRVEWRANDALRPAIYGPDSPLSISPTPDEIRAITPDRLRNIHFSRLNPSETHIFLSGGIKEEMLSLVADSFGSLTQDVAPAIRPLVFPTHETGERIHTSMPDSLQSALSISIPMVGRDNPDFVPLRIAVMALGGYFGSRLMLNIREEKGLTYGIGAALVGYKEKGFLSITTQTATEYVSEVEKEVLYEIERMKDPASYTPDELARLGLFIRSALASSLDTTFSRMDLIQSYILTGAPDGYFEQQDSVARSLSPDLLAEMAVKYFDTNLIFTSIAGKE